MVVDASPSLLGGISSAYRINPYTGRYLTVRGAHGPYLELTNGSVLIDMFMAHGSTVLGHAHPAVIHAIRDHLEAGVIVGYETGLGEVVASELTSRIPSAEKVRFVASGSEAVATALRIARAHTGRDIIIKIDGHFHGGSDYAMLNSLVRSVDIDNPGGRPSKPIFSSGGIPRVVADTVIPVPWNDLPALEAAFVRFRNKVAGVIMVPIDFNNGCVLPTRGYLAAARDMAHAEGALLIFDEVLSGFKTGFSGAQGTYAVTPDVTTLSKALSSGVPLSVIVGKDDVMQVLMRPGPQGAIQGGTFAGNVLGLAAAEATIRTLAEPSFYPILLGRSEQFFRQLQAMLDASPTPARVQWAGCMFTIYIGTRDPVESYADIRCLDPSLARVFFSRAIDRGVYFHSDFSVSAAHTQDVLDEVLARLEDVSRQGAA